MIIVPQGLFKIDSEDTSRKPSSRIRQQKVGEARKRIEKEGGKVPANLEEALLLPEPLRLDLAMAYIQCDKHTKYVSRCCFCWSARVLSDHLRKIYHLSSLGDHMENAKEENNKKNILL